MKKVWVYDPHSGGVKIPQAVRDGTRNRILAYAEKHYAAAKFPLSLMSPPLLWE